MIFKQVQEIIDGTKTQTRRVCKPGEIDDRTLAIDASECPDISITIPHKITAVFTGGERDELRVKWHVGKSYAVVPKRGAPTYIHNGQPLRIRLVSIRQQFLTEITEDDARAEGVASVAEYRALWESINGKTKGARWDDNPLVWVLTFEVVR